MKKALPRVALALLAVALVFLPDAQSQQRKRTSRRATSRVRAQPVPTPQLPADEPSVVSTADDPQESQPRRTTGRTTRPSQQSVQSENDRLHGTVRDLSTQVEQLSGQLNQMKADQRAMYDLERLTRAEQRAEELRRQLREITDKEFQLQERLAEIDYEAQPDSIQRRAALIGSLNPGAVRDAIAQQLEREGTSRKRLDAAVATADAEVERLRQRVDAADQAQQPAAPGTTAPTNVTPQPSPTPTPAQPPM